MRIARSRMWLAATFVSFMGVCAAAPANAAFTVYRPDPLAVAACWKYVDGYGGVYQTSTVVINKTSQTQSGRVEVHRPGVGMIQSETFPVAPGEWKLPPIAHVAAVPNDVYKVFVAGQQAVAIPANGFPVYMDRCEGTSGETILARAHEWYRKSNGWVPGVAPFGRNVYRTHDGYRTDCSGMVAWAWGLPAPGSTSHLIGPNYGRAVNVTDLQPGDVLGTTSKGHITLFARWVNKSNWTYLAYDFGGGGAGNTGNADGRVEFKEYRLTSVSGSYAYRANDSRQYRAYTKR